MDKNNKFEYFLNAIHYNIYLEEVWSNKKLNKLVNKLSTIVFRIPFIKKYRQRHCERHKKKMDDFIYSNRVGLSISVAHHLYGYLYSCYPGFLSFLLGGLAIREFGYLNIYICLIIFAIPVGICYIPAYRAVFANDRYLKYFKKFEKEDERWHRKWGRITLAFCIGSIVSTILGICVAFAVAIL